jgi:hypothetical protein
VDAEIMNIVLTAHETATKILNEHKKLLDVMAEVLLEKETLNIDEIFEIIMKEIDDSEKEFIERKYKKACDMKIDASQGAGNSEQGTEDSEEGEETGESEELGAGASPATTENKPKKAVNRRYKTNKKEGDAE